jgi:VanZ family protein
MQFLTDIGAAVFAALGVMHAGLAAHDLLRKPKFFSPVRTDLLQKMQTTQAAIAPDSVDYWRSILSFHLSHALGILVFAVLIFAANRSDISLIKVFVLVVCVAYAGLSIRYWFFNPTVGILLGTALVISGWVL